jgi:cation diffusion facilitator CzcD-associated flavoprotein CzcO
MAQEIHDVLIVGAGVSGIGLAHHLLTECPDKSFAIIESKHTFGGTWETHSYPGIRSDSDLYTFGYRFKPWIGPPVAGKDAILNYMKEVIQDDGLDEFIHYGKKVLRASWSSDENLWSLVAEDVDSGDSQTFKSRFLWMAQGYYDHAKGYIPEWEGLENFKGQVVHPQTWPSDLQYKDKKVLVIGSGATAATLIPNMADECKHLTMLQRSPTYFWTGENRNELADRLRRLDLPEEWVHEIVRRDILQTGKDIQYASAEMPEVVKEELLKVVRQELGDEITDKHFTPSYRPWQQRLAYVPDGDLFQAIKSGKVSVHTDTIKRFTESGVELNSGEFIEADIVVSATGFNLLFLGGIQFDIDGKPTALGDQFTWKGLMLSDVPNLLYVFGYLRTSWTMRVDLIGDFITRLLKHMDSKGCHTVTPVREGAALSMPAKPWLDPDEFNPGYVKRGVHAFPNQGDQEPWVFTTDYYTEKDSLPAIDLDHSSLSFS